VVSPARWVTWCNTPGSTEDAPVVSERANSGSKSLKLFNTNPAVGPMDVVLRFGQKYSTGNFSYQMYMFLEEGKAAYFNFQRENSIGTAMAGSVCLICCSFRLFDSGQFHVARIIDHTCHHIQVVDGQIQGIKIRRSVAPEWIVGKSCPPPQSPITRFVRLRMRPAFWIALLSQIRLCSICNTGQESNLISMIARLPKDLISSSDSIQPFR
jgi:hypothetical protein